MSESAIEKKVCAYAKSKGWLHFKWSSPGQKGVPDRIFMKRGKVFFVEFKDTGKEPTTLQSVVINKIRRQGFDVYVIDSVEQGKKLIYKFEIFYMKN